MSIRTIVPFLHRLTSFALVLAAALGVARTVSAASVTRAFVIVVPPAQEAAFNQGIKAWENCLHDHGAKHRTLAYSAETGDLDRYLFLDERDSWANMDVHEAAAKACGSIFLTQVQPHASQAFSEIAILNAKDTYMPAGDPEPAPMMWVVAYRIKPGQRQTLNDALAKLATAAAKTHWGAHFAGYDIQGSGQGAENFVLVWPNRSWADIGQAPKLSDTEVIASVYGKAAARANQKRLLATIADYWTDAWQYQQGLSYIPGK